MRIKKHGVRTILSAASIVTFLMMGVSGAGAVVTPADWNFAGWSGGGAFPNIALDPNTPGRMYLLSDVAGVYTSADRGNSWARRNQGLANISCAGISIATSNPNILYVGTATGLHRSADGGTTWSLLPGTGTLFRYFRPINYKNIAIDPLNADKVYAATQTGEVYFTVDGGQTWARLGSTVYPFGQTANITAVHLTRDSSSLFIGSSLGLRRYDFSSSAWTAIDIASSAITDLTGLDPVGAVYATNGNRVAWTTDKGVTWQYSSVAPVGTGGSINRVSVITGPSGAAKILISWRSSTKGGILLSENAGSSWTNVGANTKNYDLSADPTRSWQPDFASGPLSISFDPFLPDTIYMSDYWGVWRSDDNGLNWYEKIRDLPNAVGTDLAFTSNGNLLASAMDQGILRSQDGGATYQALVPNAGFKGNNVLGHVWRVKAIGSNKIIATNTPWDTNYKNQVLVSEDSGATFSIVTAGLPTAYPVVNTNSGKGYPRGLAVDPMDPLKVYLGIDGDDGGGFFYSTDGGYNWTRSAGQPGSKRIFNGLAVDPVEPNRLYWGAVGAGGGIYRSENSGQTWSPMFNSTSWVFDLAVAKDQSVYAATASSGPVLYVSRNKGTSWSLLKRFPGTAGACLAVTPDPNNALRIAVSATTWSHQTGGKIYMTEDGGITWTEITGDFPYSDGLGAMAFSPDGQTLYASAMAGSVYKLSLATPDTTAPSAPTSLTATVSGTQAVLSWTASTDNTGVTIYEVFNNGTMIGTNVSATFLHDGVAGTTYNYSVVAKDAAGNASGSSNIVTVTIPTQQTAGPSAPTNLSGSYVNGQVQLSWTAPATATGYNVYRNDNWFKWVTAPSTFDNTVSTGNTYRYKVIAFNDASQASTASAEISVSVGGADTTAPTAPSGLTASLSGSTANLSWSASTDNVAVTGYRIYEGTAQIGTATSLTHSVTGLSAGSHSYTVKAIDAAGNLSAPSNSGTVTVPSPSRATPTNLTAGFANGQVQLSWTASSFAASYNLYRNNVWLKFLPTPTSVATDSTVVAGRTYSYKLQAFDYTTLPAPYSSEVSISIPVSTADTTAPTAPSGLTASLSGSTANLSWSASTDNVAVTGYRIYEGTAQIGTATSLTHSVTGLSAGSHSYTVKAIDAAGNLSGSSNTAVVTGASITPGTPADLIAYLSGTSVSVAWSSAANAAGYSVYRNEVFLANVTSSSMMDTNIVAGQTYTYKVRAYTSTGVTSSFSNSMSVTVPAAEPIPAIPANFRVSAGSNGNISIHWSESAGAAGYNLYRNGVMYLFLGGTMYEEHPGGGTWKYKLQARNNSGGVSGFTSEITVRTSR